MMDTMQSEVQAESPAFVLDASGFALLKTVAADAGLFEKVVERLAEGLGVGEAGILDAFEEAKDAEDYRLEVLAFEKRLRGYTVPGALCELLEECEELGLSLSFKKDIATEGFFLIATKTKVAKATKADGSKADGSKGAKARKVFTYIAPSGAVIGNLSAFFRDNATIYRNTVARLDAFKNGSVRGACGAWQAYEWGLRRGDPKGVQQKE